jgi:broad specificity phosphatase PhoE
VATTLWLVRHGETQANVDGIFQGQMDTLLNARGQRQAREVAALLGERSFDVIYSSDLRRCADTARAIATLTGHDIVFDPDLRELHYGVLQGVQYQHFHEVLARYGLSDEWGPGVFSQRGIAPPEGESIGDLRVRVARFVERIDSAHATDLNHEVLVVSHGGTLRALMTVLLGLPIEQRSSYAFANCSVTRVVRDAANGTIVECLNEIYWREEDFPVSAGEGEAAYGVDQAPDIVIAREVSRGDADR